MIRNEKSGVFPHKMIDQHYGGSAGFWNFLKERDNDNCLLGCSIKVYGKEDLNAFKWLVINATFTVWQWIGKGWKIEKEIRKNVDAGPKRILTKLTLKRKSSKLKGNNVYKLCQRE